MKYADRARQIKNKPVINLDPVALELATLRFIIGFTSTHNTRKQVQLLKAELMKYKEGGYLPEPQPPVNGTVANLKQESKSPVSPRFQPPGTTEFEEQIKKLKEDNMKLLAENKR